MNIFYKIIIGFFLLLLVILLIILGIDLNNNKYKFVPVLSDCPDYWETTLDTNNNIVCINTHNLGLKSQCNISKFTTDKKWFLSNHIKCNLKNFFNRCKITWDGLTNNDTLKC